MGPNHFVTWGLRQQFVLLWRLLLWCCHDQAQNDNQMHVSRAVNYRVNTLRHCTNSCLKSNDWKHVKRYITPYHAFIKNIHLKHVNKVFTTTSREHWDSWKRYISKRLQNVTQWFRGWGHDGTSDSSATEVSSCSSRVGTHDNEARWWRVCWNATMFTVEAFRFRNEYFCCSE